MIRNLLSKSVLCGALAVFTVLTVVPQQAEAGPVRVRFTPLFGTPFPDLDWGGVVDIGDGACTDTGTVSNLIGSCAGQFSFLSATLTLTDVTNPLSTQSIALNTSSAQVFSVQRTGLTPDDFGGAVSTPFAPVQGTIPATKYSGTGDGGWFSLVLVGGKDVQLYWFDKNPGSYFLNPSLYTACGKAGDNVVGDYRCGSSANTAIAIFQPVPEPSTYALLAAGLGAVGFVARRRARRG
jgi:hypothetical protein